MGDLGQSGEPGQALSPNQGRFLAVASSFAMVLGLRRFVWGVKKAWT